MKRLIGTDVVLEVVLVAVLLSGTFLEAQQGYKAVYGTGNNATASSAWIDASAWCTNGSSGCGMSGTDVCAMIRAALPTLTTGLGGGVLDARGVVPLPSGAPSAQMCSVNPFIDMGMQNAVPVTVLLPGGAIQLPQDGTWTLPNNVHLVGASTQTILQDNSQSNCCTSGGSMIRMGPLMGSGCPSPAPSGISVEHLKLQGSVHGSDYYGIENDCARASSYVNDVGIVDTPSTGLYVGSGAAGSGPYTNLSISQDSQDGCSGGTSACVDLEASTQGLHGLTCVGDMQLGGEEGKIVSPGIIVNASNNTLNDIHIESYWDGIEIGDVGSGTISNVAVSNVLTSTTATCGTYGWVRNAVHICGPVTSATFGGACPNAANGQETVTDVTLLGISNGSFETGSNPPEPAQITSVVDDVTGTVIAGCWSCKTSPKAQPTVGLYAIGEVDADDGGAYAFSRFTTSPANTTFYGSSSSDVATWGVGATTVNPNTACYTPGALYSDTSATGRLASVFVCSGNPSYWLALPIINN